MFFCTVCLHGHKYTSMPFAILFETITTTAASRWHGAERENLFFCRKEREIERGRKKKRHTRKDNNHKKEHYCCLSVCVCVCVCVCVHVCVRICQGQWNFSCISSLQPLRAPSDDTQHHSAFALFIM